MNKAEVYIEEITTAAGEIRYTVYQRAPVLPYSFSTRNEAEEWIKTVPNLTFEEITIISREFALP